MNDWKAIRAHYKSVDPMIFAEKKNEWAIDAYAWDNGMIEMTFIEKMLWSDIRLNNAVFYPQYPIGKFVVDFANPIAKVAIECDGAAYHLDKEKDAARDQELAKQGWTVYRITGAECVKDFDEESMEPSPSFKFIQRIVEEHGLRR